MNLIIDELRKALNNQCYLSALTLALTIPDICGKLEYPEITGIGCTGKRYKKWFNEYVKKYFTVNDPANTLVYFNGKDCYALRNAILHSGQSEASARIQKFKLSLPEGPIPVQLRYDYSTKDHKDVRTSIDIHHLSWCIGMGMTEWLSSTDKNTEDLKLLTFFRPDEFFEH